MKKIFNFLLSGMMLFVCGTANVFAEDEFYTVELPTQYFEPCEDEIYGIIVQKMKQELGSGDFEIISYEEITAYTVQSSPVKVGEEIKKRSFYPGGQGAKGSKFPNGGSISYIPTGGQSDSVSVGFGGVSYTVSLPRGSASTGSVGSYNYTVPATNLYVRLYMTRQDRISFYRVTYSDQEGTHTTITTVPQLYSLSPSLTYTK